MIAIVPVVWIVLCPISIFPVQGYLEYAEHNLRQLWRAEYMETSPKRTKFDAGQRLLGPFFFFVREECENFKLRAPYCKASTAEMQNSFLG